MIACPPALRRYPELHDCLDLDDPCRDVVVREIDECHGEQGPKEDLAKARAENRQGSRSPFDLRMAHSKTGKLFACAPCKHKLKNDSVDLYDTLPCSVAEENMEANKEVLM